MTREEQINAGLTKSKQPGETETPAPVVEKPVEAEETTPPIETPAAETTPPATESSSVDYESEYKKLKGDFDALEANPILKELFTQQKGGRNVDHDFISKAYRNYDAFKPKENLSHAEALVTQALIEDGYSEEEAKLKLEHEYAALFSEDGTDVDTESRDYKLAKVELERKADAYLNGKKEAVTKYRQLQPNQQVKTVEQYNADLVAQREQHIESMKKAANKIMDGVEKIEMEADGTKFTFEVSKEVKAEMKKNIVNYDTLLQTRYNPQGRDLKELENQIREDQVWLDPKLRAKAIQLIKADEAARAVQAFVKGDLKNSDPSKTTPHFTPNQIPQTGDERQDRIARHFGKGKAATA